MNQTLEGYTSRFWKHFSAKVHYCCKNVSKLPYLSFMLSLRRNTSFANMAVDSAVNPALNLASRSNPS